MRPGTASRETAEVPAAATCRDNCASTSSISSGTHDRASRRNSPEAGLRNAEETLKCYRLLAGPLGEPPEDGRKLLMAMELPEQRIHGQRPRGKPGWCCLEKS